MHSFNYFFYRYRFLLLYTAFGIISLFTELLVARALISFNFPSFISIIFSFIAGLLIVVSIFLLWKYEEFKELSLIFVIQVVVGLILLRYYDD